MNPEEHWQIVVSPNSTHVPPFSHGCVRQSPNNSKKKLLLFKLGIITSSLTWRSSDFFWCSETHSYPWINETKSTGCCNKQWLDNFISLSPGLLRAWKLYRNNYILTTHENASDILELISIVRMETPAIRPVGLKLIQIVKKTMAAKALKGQYVALLVQSLPHFTTSTNPLLRLNSLIQQTDTRYFSSDTGQMDGKEKSRQKQSHSVELAFW